MAPTEVTAEAILMSVLVDGFQEVVVPYVLLAATTCQQGCGYRQHLIHLIIVSLLYTSDAAED